MNDRLALLLVQHRWPLAVFSLLLAFGLLYGAQKLYFDSNYEIFFEDDNPQLVANKYIEDTFAKIDNVAFILAPKDGNVFTRKTLGTIEWLTEEGWTFPYSIRVDSLANYQHTEADGDDLTVGNLYEDAASLSDADLERIRNIALNERTLVTNLVSEKGDVALVNIRAQIPPGESGKATYDVMARAFAVREQLQERQPDLEIHIYGVLPINYWFDWLAIKDSSTLIPAMFLAVLAFLWILLRSIPAVIAIVVVIILSILGTMGFTGWVGFALNQVNVSAPIIILTLSVADGVHLLSVYLRNIAAGQEKTAAMQDAMKLNLQPIFLTSVTTAIGFASANFSDSPPFAELGTISAFGVMAAFWFSIALIPAFVMALPSRGMGRPPIGTELMTRLGTWVTGHSTPLFWGTLVVVAFIVAFVPRNELTDNTKTYFSKELEFRQGVDFLEERLSGADAINYALDCGEPNCINDPEFLRQVEQFTDWYRAQPEVPYVRTYTDVIKRLNQNMHGDDPAYYRLPEERPLAAQYLLLYEMSLPFGLDLSNFMNADKSALWISAVLREQNAKQIIALEERVQEWMAANVPDLQTTGSSVSLMFAHIGQRNIYSMITGSVVALFLISVTLIVSLRSLKYGLISIIPNAFPAAMAFGFWGMFVAQVNLAVAVVFSISLGIVVDDTVHFLSKYMRAVRNGTSGRGAVEYAFRTVGSPLLTTSLVLATGFFIMATSPFAVNSMMGTMVGMTILIALVFDLLFLPALLLKIDQWTAGTRGARLS